MTYELEELEIRHRLNKKTNPTGELARLMYERVMSDNEELLKISREFEKQLQKPKVIALSQQEA